MPVTERCDQPQQLQSQLRASETGILRQLCQVLPTATVARAVLQRVIGEALFQEEGKITEIRLNLDGVQEFVGRSAVALFAECTVAVPDPCAVLLGHPTRNAHGLARIEASELEARRPAVRR